MDEDTLLAQKFTAILPHLNEKQRRLLLAAEARTLGHGGISQVARAAGVSRATIHQALDEQEQPGAPGARVRRPGGGRKKTCDRDPTLLADLEALVDPDTRGDPMSPLRWTCKSTRQLAAALTQRGHQVSERIVRNLLHAAGYSLQANAKTREGRQHPDRDAQFRYLNEQMKAFLGQGCPVVSVDTKKKELIGHFKNGGREWQPQGSPEQVNVHDFPDPALGKAIPYGIYDVGRNMGWVTVGQDHDTASFAVASLQRWWEGMGRQVYPGATQLLLCADSGGSNGYRVRLWKVELQRFADETSLQVTVCHLPPGTSKWNKIEHRLFAHISMNWRGRPLVSHEVIVELIGATTTREGLHVQADLDMGLYPTKIKVSNAELAAVQLTPHTFHGEWNYTISPTCSEAHV
jgi:AcrR family transcriptional regulator